LAGKRGVYFVDILSNGYHARCVLKIGDIRSVSRVTEAGHVFQLFDEDNGLIEKGSIYMSKHLYKSSNARGEIFVPFTTSPTSAQKIILERDDDPNFNVLTTFRHQSESYRLQCGIYVDREQLLEKKRASIVLRPALFLNDVRVTNKLLDNVCDLRCF